MSSNLCHSFEDRTPDLEMRCSDLTSRWAIRILVTVKASRGSIDITERGFLPLPQGLLLRRGIVLSVSRSIAEVRPFDSHYCGSYRITALYNFAITQIICISTSLICVKCSQTVDGSGNANSQLFLMSARFHPADVQFGPKLDYYTVLVRWQ